MTHTRRSFLKRLSALTAAFLAPLGLRGRIEPEKAHKEQFKPDMHLIIKDTLSPHDYDVFSNLSTEQLYEHYLNMGAYGCSYIRVKDDKTPAEYEIVPPSEWKKIT